LQRPREYSRRRIDFLIRPVLLPASDSLVPVLVWTARRPFHAYRRNCTGALIERKYIAKLPL